MTLASTKTAEPTKQNGTSPHTRIRELISGYWVAQAVAVAARTGIADFLADGPKCSDQVSQAIGGHDRTVFRLLRALAGVGVLRQLDDRRFELTDTGQYLRADVPGSLRSYALLFGGERQWRAWSNFEHSVRTGESAYEAVFGLRFYDYFEQNPEAAQTFDQAMLGSITRANAAVAAAYDFSAYQLIVELGGGEGGLMSTILGAHPDVRGVLLETERKEVVERAAARIEAAGFGDRCQVVGGDFFRSVPSGGDLYVLSRVLHVFDDETNIRILRNCRSAMSPGSGLVIVERVIPEGNAPFFGKTGDLNMLVLTGGCERTEAEFQALLQASGFKLDRVIPTTSEMSLIEASPDLGVG